jgi:hypothetical protein
MTVVQRGPWCNEWITALRQSKWRACIESRALRIAARGRGRVERILVSTYKIDVALRSGRFDSFAGTGVERGDRGVFCEVRRSAVALPRAFAAFPAP